jgi:MoaA/NifB/PqqE/SkfB family radical SAM enzyme
MRGLAELVFSTTNQCNARCRDCPVVSPNNRPARLNSEVMMRIVDEVHGWSALRLVVFTGGESFLLLKDIHKALAHVAKKGISRGTKGIGTFGKQRKLR